MTDETKMQTLDKKELATFEPQYKNLITEAKVLRIKDEVSKKRAIDLIRELNLLFDQYQNAEDKVIKPLKDHIKNLEKETKPYKKAITEIVGKDSYSGLRGQLSDYETKMAEDRRKEEERLRAEQQKTYDKEVAKAGKKGEIAPAPPPPVIVQGAKESGVSFRDDWTFDEKRVAIEQVPEIFGGVRLKKLDEKAVQKLIDAGCREIPGVPIYAKKVPIIREEKLEDL